MIRFIEFSLHVTILVTEAGVPRHSLGDRRRACHAVALAKAGEHFQSARLQMQMEDVAEPANGGQPLQKNDTLAAEKQLEGAGRPSRLIQPAALLARSGSIFDSCSCRRLWLPPSLAAEIL